MKKLLFPLFAAGAVFLALPLEARTVYITRHAQVGYPMKEIRETRITELGVKQAQALADFLVNKCKFNGAIYASPFYRTIETATYTGKLLKKKVILEPGLQEVATFPRPTPPGMKYTQIQSYFPGLTVPGKRYKDPWRLYNEPHLQRTARVAKALDAILAEEKGDVLLVGHGASVVSLVRVLNQKRVKGVRKISGTAWNCALYIVELNEKDQVIKRRYTTEFMADKDVTNNFRCPKIERPNDPKYMTRAQDKANRAKAAAKAAKAKKGAGKKAKTQK